MIRLIFFLLLVWFGLCADEEYALGRGVNIPKTPLYVGAYATVDSLHRSDNYNRFRLDELALLSYGKYEKFSFMGELLYKEAYVKEWGKVESQTKGTPLTIERLYVDYRAGDAWTLRAGKFNTPVGYWNLEPINVLRDSASNPYLAYIIYPRYTTGVLLTYADELSSDNSYTFLMQENHDFDDNYNNISLRRHYGAGFETSFNDDLHVKLNAGYFKTKDLLQQSYYAQAALQYTKSSYKINSEIALRGDEKKMSVPYAFYLQGVYNLEKKHYFIGRVEAYEIDEGAYRKEQIGVVGYTYRPVYPVALKVEYQWHTYVNENQLHMAFSMMF